jgi:hypothetical protein
LWQNVVAKRFATTQKSKKPRVLTKFWLVAKRFATTFCHKKNRWDFVKISLKFRWQAIQVNEILTKFQRNFNEKTTKILWQNMLPQGLPQDLHPNLPRSVLRDLLSCPCVCPVASYSS